MNCTIPVGLEVQPKEKIVVECGVRFFYKGPNKRLLRALRTKKEVASNDLAGLMGIVLKEQKKVGYVVIVARSEIIDKIKPTVDCFASGVKLAYRRIY